MGSGDVADDIKNGNFSLKKRQPVAQEIETHKFSPELFRNALKNLRKVNVAVEGAEGSANSDQSVFTGLEKQNNFHQSRKSAGDKLDKRGVATTELVEARKNLRKVPVAETAKVDHTAGARIMGRSLDANSINEFEKRQNQAAQLLQGFQTVKLKKTPLSDTLYKPVLESAESLERKSHLERIIEERKIAAQLELDKKKEEARVSAQRILIAMKALEEEADKRKEDTKKNMGKKSPSSGELTVLEQIRAGKKLNPVKNLLMKDLTLWQGMMQT